MTPAHHRRWADLRVGSAGFASQQHAQCSGDQARPPDRPDGTGVVGVITKADQICVVDHDPYVQMIRGQYPELGGFKPRVLASPLRAKVRRTTTQTPSCSRNSVASSPAQTGASWRRTLDGLSGSNRRRAPCKSPTRPRYLPCKRFMKYEDPRPRAYSVLDGANKMVYSVRNAKRFRSSPAVLPAEAAEPAVDTHAVVDKVSVHLRQCLLHEAVGSNPLMRIQQQP